MPPRASEVRETFKRKRDAETRHAQVAVNVHAGIHTADS
jgi:hypothetical protein